MDFVGGWLRVYVFLAGMLCLAGAAWSAWRRLQLRRKGARALGHVTGWTVTNDTEGKPEYHYARVRFVAQNGAAHDFTSSMGWGGERWPVGTSVRVLYAPSDPAQADLDQPWMELLGFGLMAALGAVAVYATVVG